MSHRDVCMYDTTHAVYTYTGMIYCMRYNSAFYTHTCAHTLAQIWIFLGSRVWTYILYLCMLLQFFLYTVSGLVHMLVLGETHPRKVIVYVYNSS